MFVRFGTSHIVALALVAVAAALAIAAVRRWPGPRAVPIVRAILALVLMASWALWVVFVDEAGWASVGTLLPMNLCDWATIAVTITLIHPDRKSFELAYFWALAGTSQALLTPALALDYPSPAFIVFFALHGGVIVGVLFLTLGLGMRPWPSSIPRVLLWSFAYLAAALAANAIFGTNFGFLSEKPPEPSLLDALAPWPYYIGEEVLIGALAIALLYAPFFLRDRTVERRSN